MLHREKGILVCFNKKYPVFRYETPRKKIEKEQNLKNVLENTKI